MIIVIIASSLLLLPLLTIVLTVITWLRQRFSSSSSDGESMINTALYCGRVSHTRFQPVIHSFSYPLFFCLVDLSEVKDLFHEHFWPLNVLMTFRDDDHLKNGEGLRPDLDMRDSDNNLSCRIRRLVSERTNGKFNPKPEQKILILTHLCYFGYCFNPVSFYYILKDNHNFELDDGTRESIEAIVAEVSNTPWNEMKCYVLHPDSCDIQVVKEGRSRKSDESYIQNDWKSMNYVFNKKFHVSPFMEMNYIYDWTFWQFKKDRIIVNTLMIKQQNENELKKNLKCFSAFFDIKRSSFSPFSLCYQLLKFPVYCFIIQIWIHYEALKLFWKGIEFIPHPEGSQTKASAIIATVMKPFFALKEWSSHSLKKKDDSKQKFE